jgi:PhoPQ-activated pathogenicity-related protein
MRPLILVLAAAASLHAQVPQPASRGHETALDRYVAAPDTSFAFKKVAELPASGVTATVLELTSQRWLTDAEVDRPVWKHWLVIYRPATVRSDVALLYISGGAHTRPRPGRANAVLARLAAENGTVTAELRMVPNQPLTLLGDPEKKPREEDDLIAYTWDKYLRTGDEKWPLRLPMTKAAVRAMDAVTAWSASTDRGSAAVRRFVVSGGSKRGWTTWTTAAVDSRVVAIAPAVIDVLNVEPSFVHHWRAYGLWAPAVGDYVTHGIMNWMGTKPFKALMAIEDPWSYRDRLTMPKFLVNSAGDQFFLPDSSQFYLNGLRGETLLRYIPNSDHSLDDTNAFDSLGAFYASVVSGRARPSLKWSRSADGTLSVTASTAPKTATLWTATNPSARDFRLETVGKIWQATRLQASGPNAYAASVAAPPQGWTASFAEFTFDVGASRPLTITTDVHVAPETLPFPAPPQPNSKGSPTNPTNRNQPD